MTDRPFPLPSPDPTRQALYEHHGRKFSVVKLPDTLGFYAPRVWELAELLKGGSVKVMSRYETLAEAVTAIEEVAA